MISRSRTQTFPKSSATKDAMTLLTRDQYYKTFWAVTESTAKYAYLRCDVEFEAMKKCI